MPRIAIVLALAAMTSAASHAQEPQRRRVLPELRADVVIGHVLSAQLAAGVHITSGTYFRVALLGGYGRAWSENETSDSYRAEVQGRFHLDPLRSNRFGLYGIGGVTAGHDSFAGSQSRLVLGAGAELPAYARTTFAVEAVLAGGLRLSLAVRRVPLGRR